jgi:hypothetical protein
MKPLLGIVLSLGFLGAQHLSVVTATSKKIVLAWSAAQPGATVERKSGAAFVKLGDATADSFTDDRIAPFGTYRYRLRAANGAYSKVVTVGPPPLGVNVVARVPKGIDPATYGAAAALTADENGDPAVAFIWVDPNNDQKRDDTAVYFSRWNRATYSWKAPVQVGVTGDISARNSHLVSVACDPASGTFAIAYSKNDQNGALIAISTDGGATWKSTPVAGHLEGEVFSVGIVENGGNWLAAIHADGGMRFLTGAIADPPATWKSQAPPAGTRMEHKIAIAPVASGGALVAFWSKPEHGDNAHILVWDPQSGKIATAADSNGQDCDDPDVRLNITGGTERILMDCPRDPKEDRQGIWYTASTESGGWTTPVKLPVDGPRSTNSPMGLAVSASGKLAAAFASGSGGAGTECGYPVVARSTNGVNWTACGPGKRSGGDFEGNSSAIDALYTADGRLNVLWHDETDTKYGMGMLLWRE